MKPDDAAVQIVLFVDVMLKGEPYRHEHFAVTLSEAHVDLAEAMGVGHILLFPGGHGIESAAALAPHLDRTIVKLRDFPADYSCFELTQRLRDLVLACDRTPNAKVMARTVAPR